MTEESAQTSGEKRQGTGETKYRDLSFWHDTLGSSALVPRAALDGNTDADVAIAVTNDDVGRT